MCLDKNTENETYFFNNNEMKNSSGEKIIGITVDYKLKLKFHVKSLCKKASQKDKGFVTFNKLLRQF